MTNEVTLYGALDEMRSISDTLDGIDAAEHPEDALQLEQQLETAVAAVLKKGDSFIAYLRQLDSWTDAAKAEAKRLTERAKAASNRSDKLRAYAKAAMEATGQKKLEFALGSLSLRQSPASVLITSESMVPAAFKTVVETVSIDKRQIAAAIKAGQDVPGADLIPGGMSLVIK